MISLFLDTSSSNLNVGVLKNKELLKEKYIHFEKDLSKYALNEIKELLDSNVRLASRWSAVRS